MAHFQELPNISAFGDTPQKALEELKLAWELVKEDYKMKNRKIPVVSNRKKIAKLRFVLKVVRSLFYSAKLRSQPLK